MKPNDVLKPARQAAGKSLAEVVDDLLTVGNYYDIEPHEDELYMTACRHCSYDLTGNTSGICPECGTAVPRESEAGA